MIDRLLLHSSAAAGGGGSSSASQGLLLRLMSSYSLPRVLESEEAALQPLLQAVYLELGAVAVAGLWGTGLGTGSGTEDLTSMSGALRKVCVVWLRVFREAQHSS